MTSPFGSSMSCSTRQEGTLHAASGNNVSGVDFDRDIPMRSGETAHGSKMQSAPTPRLGPEVARSQPLPGSSTRCRDWWSSRRGPPEPPCRQ